jgi:zinc protease
MFKDSHPKKWLLLLTLFIIVLVGIILFFGLRAQAAGEKFLPIKEVSTPGGISVWLVEDHSLPVIAMKFIFLDSGTALDPEDRQGLVRMLSNTMDEGAGEMDSQAFQKALKDNSITLMFNAGRDGFGGELKTLTRNSTKAFDLMALAMTAPRFDTEAVERMRNGNLSRIKSSLSEPDWMSARLMNDKGFEAHPYAKNSGGTLSSLGRITPDDLRKFKETYLTRDRLLIAVAGDIKPETLGPAIDKVFGKLPVKAPQSAITDITVKNAGKTYLFEQDIPQTMVEVLLPSIDRKDKDYFALQVLNYIYGGAGFGSRLMEEAREKRGLTYGIYSSIQNMQHSNALSVSASTKNESAAEMLSIIQAEMTKLQTTPVTQKELADAISYITGSMPLALDSTDSIAGVVLGLRSAEQPIDYLDHYADNIRSVTAEDIQRVAKRILKPEAITTVLVGKPVNIQNAEIVKELPNVQ